MASLSIPNTFANGDPADADDVNENFTAVETAVNLRYHKTDDDEDDITFKAGGHDHSGGANGEPVTDATGLPLAVNNGAKGLLKIRSGSVTIAHDAEATIDLSATFTQVFSVDVYWSSVAAGEGFTQLYQGGSAIPHWYVRNLLNTSFRIRNRIGTEEDFIWRAIGI